MKESVKKGIRTTLTLGAIVLAAGALIGVTSAFTSPYVYAHSLAARLEAVREVFPDADDVSEPHEFETGVLSERYEVKKGGELLGWAYSASGSNQYGEIEATIGIDADGKLKRIVITKLDQSQPSPVNTYVDEVNAGDRDYTDTQCGSTYGANTIKSFVDAALTDAKTLTSGEVSEDLALVWNVFPKATDCSEMETLNIEVATHPDWIGGMNKSLLNGRYEVFVDGETVGYAYRGVAASFSEMDVVLLGIQNDGTLGRLYLISASPIDEDHGYYEQLDNNYIGEVNNGTRWPDDVKCGATTSAAAVFELYEAACEHMGVDPVLGPTTGDSETGDSSSSEDTTTGAAESTSGSESTGA